MNRKEQLNAIVTKLTLLGYSGQVPLEVAEDSNSPFMIPNSSEPASLEETLLIATILMDETPYFRNIERLLEFMFIKRTFIVIEGVSNWEEVGEYLIHNDLPTKLHQRLVQEGLYLKSKQDIGRWVEKHSAVDFSNRLVICTY